MDVFYIKSVDNNINVISRLRLYYNTEHVLEIRSEGENRGTEVILYLPDPDTGEGEEDV